MLILLRVSRVTWKPAPVNFSITSARFLISPRSASASSPLLICSAMASRSRGMSRDWASVCLRAGSCGSARPSVSRWTVAQAFTRRQSAA